MAALPLHGRHWPCTKALYMPIGVQTVSRHGVVLFGASRHFHDALVLLNKWGNGDPGPVEVSSVCGRCALC